MVVTRVATGSVERRTSPWPRYDAADTGMRNFWYPVAWSRDVRGKPFPLRLAGEDLVLLRDGGRVYALQDQCPHRGIPLRVGHREFPGTWTCRYHGWTFDLATGQLTAALTDGPDSPICGKVRVRSYPAADRAGLVWVFIGEADPPPLETQIPKEMLEPDAVVAGRITIQSGNWRNACENGIDLGHAWYLHRRGSLWTKFDRIPAWTRASTVVGEDGWMTSTHHELHWEGDYPGLGHWPPPRRWAHRSYRVNVHNRLPGVLRLQRIGKPYLHIIWWTPVDKQHYRMLQFYVQAARGIGAWLFRLTYHLFWKPLHHVQFNGQDAWMVSLAPASAPERLYRPDGALTIWRKLCEQALAAQPAPTAQAASHDQPIERRAESGWPGGD